MGPISLRRVQATPPLTRVMARVRPTSKPAVAGSSAQTLYTKGNEMGADQPFLSLEALDQPGARANNTMVISQFEPTATRLIRPPSRR